MRRYGLLCRGSFLALALVACSGGSNANLPASPALVRASQSGSGLPDASGAGNLYVANYYASSVVVYANGGRSQRHTITSGIAFPNSLAIDGSGDLFVGNFGAASGSQNSSITVYGPNKSQPSRTITDGVYGPYAMDFDRTGKLYVANFGGGTVTVYKHGATKPFETIVLGIDQPEALALDDLKNVYVANWQNDSITVYKPGKLKPFEKITAGVGRPAALALDASRNLYVGNQRTGTVTVYAPLKKKQPRAIKHVGKVIALLSTADKELYVLSYSKNVVYVYDESTLSRVRGISSGIACPTAMSLNKNGQLYVANSCPSSVTVYAPGGSKPLRTITRNISYPSAVRSAP